MNRRSPGLQVSIAYMDYKNLPGGRFLVVGVRSVKKRGTNGFLIADC